MLHLDISATLAKTITPSYGIPEQELTAIQPSLRRHIEEWVKVRQIARCHAWADVVYDEELDQQVQDLVKRQKTRRIRTVLWIGIGGSSLGPRVIQQAFESQNTVEFIVLDSIDPYALQSVLELVDWKETLVVIASKSGETLEPMSIFFLCWEQLRSSRKEKAAEHVIAVTDPKKGSLYSFATEHNIPILPIDPDIGGRYSIFTPIGLLPLALLGKDTKAFREGAKEMDTLCKNPDLSKNPAALLAAVQFLLETKRDYILRTILTYSWRFRSIARWNQQLIAESLGKNEIRNPFPAAAIGTQDQHSLLQQWMQGPRKSWHLFIRELKKPKIAVPENIDSSFSHIAGKDFGELFDASYAGTAGALTKAKRPHVTISISKIDEFNLGQLFYCFLAEVIFLGKLYRIDPYGQPGVELEKNMTKKLLSQHEQLL